MRGRLLEHLDGWGGRRQVVQYVAQRVRQLEQRPSQNQRFCIMGTASLLGAASLLCAAHHSKSQRHLGNARPFHTELPGGQVIKGTVMRKGMYGSPWAGNLSTRRK